MEEQLLLLENSLLKILLLEDERSDWVDPMLQYQPFASNVKKRKQGIDVLRAKLHDMPAHTAGENKMI
jgi:hypothetical protein